MDISEILNDLTTHREKWRPGDDTKCIESAEIEIVAGTGHVWAISDGQRKIAFSYYTDELTFTSEELVGLTLAEARQLYMERDLAYLRS